MEVFLDDVANPPAQNKINLMFMPFLQDDTGQMNQASARGGPLVGSVTRNSVTYDVYYAGKKNWADHVYEIIPTAWTKDTTINIKVAIDWIRTNHSGTAITNSKPLTSVYASWELIEVVFGNKAFTSKD